MRRCAGWLLAIAMLGSAALHVYWVLGGTWFLATALNMDVVHLPGELVWITWLFVAAMLLTAAMSLARIGVLPSPRPRWLVPAGLWCLAGVMLVGAIFNASLPRFWDRWVFAPIFFVLAVLAFVIARSDPPAQ
jgi:hypothetical protein